MSADLTEVQVLECLQNPEVFKARIPNSEDFYVTARKFPHHAVALAQVIVDDPDPFEQYTPSFHDLYLIGDKVPAAGEALFERILRNPAAFNQVVCPISELSFIPANFFHHVDRVIETLFRHPETFRNAFKGNRPQYDLHGAALQHPKYAHIFNKPTVDEALVAANEHIELQRRYARSRSEVKKNILTFFQFRHPRNQGESNFFQRCPVDLLYKFAAFTRDPGVMELEEAEQIARVRFQALKN